MSAYCDPPRIPPPTKPTNNKLLKVDGALMVSIHHSEQSLHQVIVAGQDGKLSANQGTGGGKHVSASGTVVDADTRGAVCSPKGLSVKHTRYIRYVGKCLCQCPQVGLVEGRCILQLQQRLAVVHAAHVV